MKRIVVRRSVALALALTASSCIHTPVAMMASSKPLAPDGYEVLGAASATDCKWLLLGVIPISSGKCPYTKT